MRKETYSLLALTLATAGMSSTASAYYMIYSPNVEYGETEVELYSHVVSDQEAAVDGAQQYVLEVGKGFTPKLFLEAKLEAEKESTDDALKSESIAAEGVYQLTETGEYGWDVGLLGEIEYSIADDKLAAVAFGPVLATDIGRNMTLTTNLIAEHGFEEESTETSLNGQLKWRIKPTFEPAIEVYTNDADERLMGPVVMGKFKTRSGKIGYQAGWLAGLNDTSADNVFKFEIEYEF